MRLAFWFVRRARRGVDKAVGCCQQVGDFGDFLGGQPCDVAAPAYQACRDPSMSRPWRLYGGICERRFSMLMHQRLDCMLLSLWMVKE